MEDLPALLQDPILQAAAAGLAIGVALSALLAFALLTKARTRAAMAEASALRAEAAVAGLQQALMQAETRTARAEAALEAERTQSAQKQALLDQAEQKLSQTFEALAGKTLRESQESFLKTAQESFKNLQTGASADLEKREAAIKALVEPMREGLKQMRDHLHAVEKDRHGAYQELRTEVLKMGEQHSALRQETSKLVTALRAPKSRGRWGELQLKRVVELAGMVSHVDFREQVAGQDAEGKRQIPDLIVHLPGGQQIAVDAKVPLDAFLNAVDLTDDAARHEAMGQVAEAVRGHVRDLGRKSYWEQLPATPEFVVLFLPGEHIFSVALEHRPSLIEEGADARVIIATPTTLLALLRAVHYGWRQESLAENANKIAEQGRTLYDRLSKMGEHLTKVGTHMGRAMDAYNGLIGNVERSVLPAARQLKSLQASEAADIDLAPLDKPPRRLQAPEFEVTTDDPATTAG